MLILLKCLVTLKLQTKPYGSVGFEAILLNFSDLQKKENIRSLLFIPAFITVNIAMSHQILLTQF